MEKTKKKAVKISSLWPSLPPPVYLFKEEDACTTLLRKSTLHRNYLSHVDFLLLCLQVRLQVGLYIVYLMDWLTVFSREQILVLRLEDHASNRKYTMHQVFEFLNLGK